MPNEQTPAVEQVARFEVRFTPNQELMEEAYRASTPSWIKMLAILMPILCWTVGSFCIYGVWAWDVQDLLGQGILLLALGALWLGYYLLRPKLAARRREKMSRELDAKQGAGSAAFRFYEEEIRGDETHGSHMVIPYDKIIKVKESQHLLLLTRKQMLMHMLDKSSLQPENLPQFKDFLREKAPQAKFQFKK